MEFPRSSRDAAVRLPPLDGVRAVAIVVVMAYHSGLPGLRTGGFYGQDAFFVLSGLLITTLLLAESRRGGRIDLVAFWGKRVRRLLPALVVMLGAVAGYVRFVAPPGRYPGFAGDARSALFYYANWHLLAASSDYFAQARSASLLTHTWSLAIEEQYYLVWPLVVLALALLLRRRRDRLPTAVLVVASVGALASAALMAVERRGGASAAAVYYDTFTHAQCLLVGSATAAGLALLRRRQSSTGMFPVVDRPLLARGLTAAAVAAATGLVTVWTRVGAASRFADEGGFLVVALCTAVVLVAVVCVPRGPVARLLGVRPVAAVGLVSYGMYLWYFPVFAVVTGAATGLRTWWLFAVRSAVVVCLATASYLVVERPLRRGSALRYDGRSWTGRLRPVVLVGAVLLATVAAAEVATPGTLAVAAAAPVAPPPTPLAAGVAGRPVDQVLLVGDSTALTLGYPLGVPALEAAYGYHLTNDATAGCGVAISAIVREHGVPTGTTPACNPTTPPAQQWPALLQADVAALHPDVVLIAAGRWEVLDRSTGSGGWQDILQPADAAYVRAQLELAVRVAASGGARVALGTAPCFSSGEQPDGEPWSEDSPARVDAYNRIVAEVAAERAGTSVVPIHDAVCPGGRYARQIGSTVVRAPDGVHYPYFSSADLQAADPDTIDQVVGFGDWLAPQVLPALLTAPAHP